ncbi:imidazolonepropionase [Martelella soudanensis]|uniref:imidazolonepropionase n=1 Tax=unclassified Martelella TaxID=2629616 RepID=UPI0015E04688|nr:MULTISPECIES: imidazolonepropionase [unclassified Martelella]
MPSLFNNALIATMAGDAVASEGVLAVDQGRIAYVGPASGLPARFSGLEAIDCGGRLITPALIDCHTHIVYGGSRAKEFGMRLEGASYEEIARAGGGIVSTVTATNALTEDELVEAALPRLDALIAEGVATIEIKSGYGLNIDAEMKMLRAARRLAARRPVRIVTTWLAAHTTPPEYKGRNAAYIAEVAIAGLEVAHAEGLVDAVDGFSEGIAFSPDELRPLFARSASLGLPVKLHAEQLSNLGGAKMAAAFGALSADHIEYLDEDGVAAMAKAGTVGVLLPGAYYTLRERQVPPVAALRAHGVAIALASDCNPGTSPLTSLLLTMNMGATLFGLTVAECLTGVTANAARALGLLAETGTLEVGKSADMALWDVSDPAELVYRIGFNPLRSLYIQGQEVNL